MRHHHRHAALGVLSAVALVGLAACGGGSSSEAGAGDGAGEISVWAHEGQEGEVAALKAAVKDFNASQSDITVKLRLIPEADYTKTVQATKVEDLPDVLEFDGPLLSSFVYDGRVSKLGDNVSSETVDNQIASAVAQNTVDGDLYGVSMFDSGLGVYGNKALLDAAGVAYPTTWQDAWTAEEFGAALEALGATDPDGLVLDVKENYGGEWPAYGFLPIVASAGSEVVGDDGAGGKLDSDAAVEAVSTFAGWEQRIDPNADDSAFVDGNVALSWVGHWMYNTYSEALGDNLVLMPLPDFGNGTKSGQGSWAWGISGSSDDAKAAGTFLDYLMGDEPVGAMTAANAAPPATTSAQAASELYREGGPLQLFADQLAATCGSEAPTPECVTVPRPVTPAYPVISTAFSKAFFDAVKGGDTAKLLKDAAGQIDRAYQDNNNYR